MSGPVYYNPEFNDSFRYLDFAIADYLSVIEEDGNVHSALVMMHEAIDDILGTLPPLSPPAPSGVEEADARPPADPPRPVAGKPDNCVNGCHAPFGIRCSVCNTDRRAPI